MTTLRRPRTLAAAAAMACAAASLAVPSSALAITSNGTSQTVLGAVTNTLGLSLSTPASVLAPIAPGSTAASTGAILVTSTSAGTWTLTVNDSSILSTSGKPVVSGAGCSNSAATLPALGVTVTGSGVTSTPVTALTGSPQNVASGSGGLPTLVTTGFSDVIPANTALINGCSYSLTAVFTASATS